MKIVLENREGAVIHEMDIPATHPPPDVVVRQARTFSWQNTRDAGAIHYRECTLLNLEGFEPGQNCAPAFADEEGKRRWESA